MAETKPLLIFPSNGTPNTLPQTPTRSRHQITPNPTPSSSADLNAITISIDSDEEEPRAYKRKRSRSCDIDLLPKNATGSLERPRQSIQPKRFSLAEVRSVIQDAYIGIPDEIHPQATVTMVKTSMAHWNQPLESYLCETLELIQSMVSSRVYEVFGSHQGTEYYSLILEICQSFFTEASSAYRKVALRVLDWELATPRTFNIEALRAAREIALNNLEAARKRQRATQLIYEQEERTGKVTAGAMADKIAKVKDVDLKPEQFSLEIHAMSVSNTITRLNMLTEWITRLSKHTTNALLTAL